MAILQDLGQTKQDFNLIKSKVMILTPDINDLIDLTV